MVVAELGLNYVRRILLFSPESAMSVSLTR
jgi:hypothetical protein